MPMDNIDLLSDNNITEDWKERKDGGKCRFSVDNEERNMIDFQPVCKISNTGAAFICVGYYNTFVAPINQLLSSVGVVSEANRTVCLKLLRWRVGICDFRLLLQ
jgi:hypothetical protein